MRVFKVRTDRGTFRVNAVDSQDAADRVTSIHGTRVTAVKVVW